MATFKEAAYEILKSSSKPLKASEITELALESGLLETEGKTPEATMAAHLYTDITKNEELMTTKETLNNFTNEIWKSAERLRGKFKAYEYQSVILPVIVIRRIEYVLIEMRQKTKEEIQSKRTDLSGKKLDQMVKKMELSTYHFSNSTNWTLDSIYQEDHTIMEKKSLIHECVTGKRRITEKDIPEAV